MVKKRELGERIAARRRELNLSQVDLAYMVNTNPTQISRYERGDSEPSSSMLAAIAQALETTPNYLLGFSDDPRAPLSPEIEQLIEEGRGLVSELLEFAAMLKRLRKGRVSEQETQQVGKRIKDALIK